MGHTKSPDASWAVADTGVVLLIDVGEISMIGVEVAGSRLCDAISRREALRIGALPLFGISSWHAAKAHASDISVAQAQAKQASSSTAKEPQARRGRAKRCIVLFLLGGPTQHSTWDPKPQMPEEIRGAYGPIGSSVPGVHIGELLPLTAARMHHVLLLRGMSTGDHAHSSSGYFMLTGQPHQPMNFENANPGAPNNWPTLGAVLQHLRQSESTLPSSVRIPQHIFNTDLSVWPGQDSGYLGPAADPWLFRCDPATGEFPVPEFRLPRDVPLARLDGRRQLLRQLDARIANVERTGAMQAFSEKQRQAFQVMSASQTRNAFDLSEEPARCRDRYGRGQFGQSVLLARRLMEADVSFVQVNWFRGSDEPANAPCWDSHASETARLKSSLVPAFDQAFSALLDDLVDRGLLEETLVIAMGEFGRTPKMNAQGGRDHWGHVFSIALAGGGIQGGGVHGSSDRQGGFVQSGLVRPQDLTATIFHCLGYAPDTTIRDALDRPLSISHGQVIREIVA